MAVAIQRMTEADLESVGRIEEICFSSPWSPQTFRLALGEPSVSCLVARFEDEVVGYAIVRLHGRQLLVANLAVTPDFQGRGLGRTLLRAVLGLGIRGGASWAVLDVRESNERAIRLYSASGFHAIGKRRGYYSDPPEDSIVMKRVLIPDSPSPPEP
jgi:[ribosomal protein S18]-alanine N-acetyltransferase